MTSQLPLSKKLQEKSIRVVNPARLIDKLGLEYWRNSVVAFEK